MTFNPLRWPWALKDYTTLLCIYLKFTCTLQAVTQCSVHEQTATTVGAVANGTSAENTSSQQLICRSCRLRNDAEKFFTIYKEHRSWWHTILSLWYLSQIVGFLRAYVFLQGDFLLRRFIVDTYLRESFVRGILQCFNTVIWVTGKSIRSQIVTEVYFLLGVIAENRTSVNVPCIRNCSAYSEPMTSHLVKANMTLTTCSKTNTCPVERPHIPVLSVNECVLFQNLTNLDRSERNAPRSQSNLICSDTSEKIWLSHA